MTAFMHKVIGWNKDVYEVFLKFHFEVLAQSLKISYYGEFRQNRYLYHMYKGGKFRKNLWCSVAVVVVVVWVDWVN